MALAVGCLLALAPAAAGKDGSDERVEVRASGRCGAGATSRLRLRAERGTIEITFEVDHARSGALWRVAVVHERRVVLRRTARTAGASASFELEQEVPDFPGADLVTARAWGPAGSTCLASASLPA